MSGKPFLDYECELARTNRFQSRHPGRASQHQGYADIRRAILGWLANGWTFEDILDSYPHLTREDILAALAFAAEMLREDEYIAIHKATA